MDEDYDRIEREMAEQNERLAKLIAIAEAALKRSAAVTDKLQHVRDELERGLVELPNQNAGQLQLERAIAGALENIRDFEAAKHCVAR